MIFSLRPRYLDGFIATGSGPSLHGDGPDMFFLCPLLETRVKANLPGPFAEVRMTQVYLNSSGRTIEARYTFPMPYDSAVCGFDFRIGDRHVEGVVRDSLGARADHEEAVAKGRRSALLEQDRENVFTLTVGHLAPGERLEVTVRYVQVLSYRSGSFTFRLPLVVAPRYVPGTRELAFTHDGEAQDVGGSTDQVPDAGRFLLPRGSGNHGVSLEMEVHPGMPIESWDCPTHDVKVEMKGAERGDPEATAPRGARGGVPASMHVTLPPGEVPDRDFVFRYRVGGPETRLGLVAHRPDPKLPGTFCVFVVPPEDIGPRDVCPRDVVFVLDCSGSMYGGKLAQAKEAVRGFLRGLNPDDRFGVVAFGTDHVTLGVNDHELLEFTEENLMLAENFLAPLETLGGTELLPAFEAALALDPDQSRVRHVIVITDGLVANESAILARVRGTPATVHVHALGIDTAVNDLFVHELARHGRGSSRLVLPTQDIEGEIAELTASIGSPLLADPVIRVESERPIVFAPRRLPDLAPGDVLVVTGTYTAPGRFPMTITGRGPRGVVEHETEIELPERTAEAPAVVTIRTRLLMLDLEHELRIAPDDDEARRKLIRLSIAHGLLCSRTSFVAIDPRISKSSTDPLVRVRVPVELPRGWQFPAARALKPATRSPWDPGMLNFTGGGLLAGFLRMFSAPEPATPEPEVASPSRLEGAERLAAIERQARLEGPRGPSVTLRTLAKRQRASGAWPEGVGETAAALIALVEGGHTDRDGTFAGQVRRAVAWLEEAVAGGGEALDPADRTLAARALEMLAAATASPSHRALALRLGTLRSGIGITDDRGVGVGPKEPRARARGGP